jgi:hypothetical protein
MDKEQIVQALLALINQLGHQPGGHGAPETDTTVTAMFSPLQQELELMKKVAGVDSAYDEPEHDCGCEGPCSCSQDADPEMDHLKHMAGITIVR